ncbi:MAG: hypothetical protein KatS3mg076_1974 [Candidatus Binatia bacterium]|nr:MAG: hypothetical protein KatS3mg076_1974 [Candidatus Binatia bacterium]
MRSEIGVYLPQLGTTWQELRAKVELCDELGIPSVWFMDHLYPPGMPRVPSFEAWTTASALASVTRRIRLGHLVLANPLRSPALLAKMAVTLDHASGGRLNLGIGSGSVEQELREFGFAADTPRRRAEQLGEALEVLRLLFHEDSPSFVGRYYRLECAPSLPRPLQRPHPPIYVGGAGERWTLPLVAKYADAWNCPTYALAEAPRKIEVLRRECQKVGRDPSSLRLTEEAVLVLVPTRREVGAALEVARKRFGGPGWGLEEGGYVGTPDDVLRRIEERQKLGFTGFFFFLADRGKRETLELFAKEVVPAVGAGGEK